MRTRSLLWTAVMALAVPAFLATGCGDDSPTGGGPEGGGGNENVGGGGNDPTGGSPTGGSGGQGGSGGAPANDTCDAPGDISIGPGEEVEIQGTLDGANDDYQTACADNTASESAIDVLYELTVTADCNATLSLDGSGEFDGVITVRSVCETDPTEQCFNANTTVAESGDVVFTAGVYYVMVSDVSNSGGTFALNIQCGAPTCGDFILDADEECDFGTGDDGVADDGCSDFCTLEPNDPDNTLCADVTAGAAVAVGLNETVFVSGSTINGESNNIGSCQETPMDGNLASKENIIKVRPTAIGTLTLTLGEDQNGNPYCGPNPPNDEPPFPFPDGCYDRSIYVRTVCATPATEVGCEETDLSGNYWDVEVLTIPVAVANVDYYVFVDGWLDYIDGGDQSDVGTYDLKIELN